MAATPPTMTQSTPCRASSLRCPSICFISLHDGSVPYHLYLLDEAIQPTNAFFWSEPQVFYGQREIDPEVPRRCRSSARSGVQ